MMDHSPALSVNLHQSQPSTFYGRHALTADGRIGRVAPDPMGSGLPVVKFDGDKYERVRGALTLTTSNNGTEETNR